MGRRNRKTSSFFKTSCKALVTFGFFQSVFAITIINQTNSDKIIKIEEAYRPTSNKPENLAAPIPLDYDFKEIKVSAHSTQTIPLKTNSSVLLVTVISEKQDSDNTVIRTESKTCYEPYDFQGYREKYFTDDWGFVIHKPIEGQHLSPSNPNYWSLRRAKNQGYGIKCLHPVLLTKITSLEELPEDLVIHLLGKHL